VITDREPSTPQKSSRCGSLNLSAVSADSLRIAQPERDQRKARAADTQFDRVERFPITQPVPAGNPRHLASSATPREFADSSGDRKSVV
jgi:hypothetical protein